MAALESIEKEFLYKGNGAFEQGNFRQAIHFWSLALEDKQAHPAVILANRSAAQAHLSCWSEALCDAQQAALLQPESVKALYRLASAQYHLQHIQQCVHTCITALRIKPNAKQLLQLLRQAEENLRAGFLSERHHEVSSAAQQALSAAAQQVQHGHWQQALQQQSSQDRSSAARYRRVTDAAERNQFMQWNRNACCTCTGHASFPISNGNEAESAEDKACNVLNIKKGLPLTDIRQGTII
ncbi:TPA: HSP70/90 co-chaperone, variant 2 [Trebouxia sp. C0004]